MVNSCLNYIDQNGKDKQIHPWGRVKMTFGFEFAHLLLHQNSNYQFLPLPYHTIIIVESRFFKSIKICIFSLNYYSACYDQDCGISGQNSKLMNKLMIKINHLDQDLL